MNGQWEDKSQGWSGQWRASFQIYNKNNLGFPSMLHVIYTLGQLDTFFFDSFAK